MHCSNGKDYRIGSNIMNAIAIQEPGSKLKGPVTDRTFSGQSFIWLPFAGGISAFAVILPKPIETGLGWGVSGRVSAERMLRRNARSKN